MKSFWSALAIGMLLFSVMCIGIANVTQLRMYGALAMLCFLTIVFTFFGSQIWEKIRAKK